jgi:NADH-quinone oxidoreductase subunit L
MTVLVLAGNALVMFVGWEGVGLASYLLIGFYFQKKSAATRARRPSSSTASATSAF